MEKRIITAFVFRNLHFKNVVYSIRGDNSKTIAHSSNIILRNAKFVVQTGGRDRVRKEKSKNVHAGVKGELVLDPIEANQIIEQLDNTNLAYYNPYTTDYFIDKNGAKIEQAEFVFLTSDGSKSKVLFKL